MFLSNNKDLKVCINFHIMSNILKIIALFDMATKHLVEFEEKNQQLKHIWVDVELFASLNL